MSKIVLGLALGLIASCASDVVFPTLINRTLVPCQNGLCYNGCKDFRFFNRDRCKRGEFKVIKYDLTKSEVVKDLTSNGFTCRSDRRFK